MHSRTKPEYSIIKYKTVHQLTNLVLDIIQRKRIFFKVTKYSTEIHKNTSLMPFFKALHKKKTLVQRHLRSIKKKRKIFTLILASNSWYGILRL